MPGRVVATCTSRDTLAPARRPFEGYACCENKATAAAALCSNRDFFCARRENTKKTRSVSRLSGNQVQRFEHSIELRFSVHRSIGSEQSLFCFDLETKRFEGWTWISPRNRNKAVANIVERMYLLLRLFTMHRCADPIASYRAR